MTKLNSGVLPTELTNPLVGLLNNSNERKRHLICLISKFWTLCPIAEKEFPIAAIFAHFTEIPTLSPTL